MKARIIPNFYRIQHQPAGQQFFNNILKKPVVYFDNASDIAKAIKPTNNNLDNIKNKIAENKVGGNTNKVKDMIAAKKTATMPPVKKEEPKINISTNNENKNKMNDFINNYRKEQANKTSGNNSSTETHVDNGVLNKPDSGDSTNGQNNTNSESTNNTTDSSTNNTQGEQQNSQQQATQPQTDNQQGEESGDFRDSEYYKNGKEIVLGEVKKDRTISEKAGKEEADELNKSAKNYKEGTLDADGIARYNAKTAELEKEVDKAIKNGWGIQKWATIGGATFGAISKYKKDLEKWEYECQRAAAEGRRMPRKPSLAGSMAMGAVGGATGGFMAGGVVKHIGPMKRIDKNLKTAGANKRMANLNAEKGYNIVQEVARRKGLDNNAKAKEINTKAMNYINKMNNSLSKDSTGNSLTQKDVGYIGRLLTSEAGYNALRNNVGLFKNMNDAQIRKWYDDANQVTGRVAFFSDVAYVSKCFSLMETYKNITERDVEKFRELYNFYTLHMNEEPMDVYSFLRECFDYKAFVRYIEQAMQRFVQEELITFSDFVNNIGNSEDTLCNYRILYKDYLKLCGTNLDPQEFIERCIYYPAYVEYITRKIKRTQLLKLGLAHFAEISSTSLPQNVQVNGETVDTTEEGLPEAKNYESMKNQNSLQTKEQQAQARQAQLQKQREEQKRQQQIEANKANYAKAQHAKAQDKVTKLSQQKAAISKNLARNASDMQTGQLAQEKQKVTNLNLKIQAVKADAKNKIANYKGTGGKNFSLREMAFMLDEKN